MPNVSMDFNLPDSSATESLGQALAHAYPSAAAESGASLSGASSAGAPLPGASLSGAPPPGASLSGASPPGTVVYLRGDLGAGKTTCVRSLLRALGVAGLVRSPTYTLVETYSAASLTCVHVDLYRVQGLTEVDELGLRDLIGPGCLLLVEWPEKGAAALPAADLDLQLEYAGDSRRARLSTESSLGSAWLLNLGRDSRLTPYVSNLT